MKRANQSSKRRQILDAAVKVFAQNGFYNSKVLDIAKEAGVANGTVYLYFPSKDDILISIFEEQMGELIDYMEQEMQKESESLNKLRKLISMQMHLIETNSELTQLLLVELRQSKKFLKSNATDMMSKYIDMISDVLKEGIAEGAIDENIDVAIVGTMLFSAVEGLATRWILEGTSYSLDKAADMVIKVFLNGISENGRR
ncbi:TetR/AcrR family transcriptional regulator [Candidatus Poribacteria bacterium]|nr:TetR/AcrR family transcriptional regulator [Candidatus Poribacteria bacterium]